MKKIIFKGSGVAIVTPMHSDGSINYDVLGELIEFQINGGTDAIIVCGTTGESATLSDEEHYNIIKYAIEKVAKRVPVIAGTGSNDTKHALELSKTADKLGADGLLIVTPYYNKTSQEGLIRHYNYIADNVNTPIIVYNVPSRTGCNIKPETYFELSKHPRIVAAKEANGDISSVAKTRTLCGDNLGIYSGCDEQAIPVMSLGGLGVISVFANICPRESHDLTMKFFNNELKESQEILYKNLELMNMLFCDVNPIPVKTALNLMGFKCGECRMPLTSMSSAGIEKLSSVLKSYGLLK